MDNIRSLTSMYDFTMKIKGISQRSAVPLGNGETGINLWVKNDGGLNFYIERTDALSENDRLLCLGKVTLNFEPNPFAQEKSFVQTLHIYDGYIEINAGGSRFKVFLPRSENSVYVTGGFKEKTTVRAEYKNWRILNDGRDTDMHGNKRDFIKSTEHAVLSYHENGGSCINRSLELHSLEKYADAVPDLITNRIFGICMEMNGAADVSDRTITKSSTDDFIFRVSTKSSVCNNTEKWLGDFLKSCESSPLNAADTEMLFAKTTAYWNRYSEESYIFVNGDKPAEQNCTDEMLKECSEPSDSAEADTTSKITQAYIFTKFMFECCAHGKFPLRFNGLLFNQTQNETGYNFAKVFGGSPRDADEEHNPDVRCWGSMDLWQNQRLPYHSMLARNERTSFVPLFSYYMRFADINRAQAKVFYHAEGQYNTEITTSYGLTPDNIYGYDRTGKALGYSENRWGGAIDISPGLELISLMLDYCDFYKSKAFFNDTLVLYAKDIFTYIAARFPARENGKIVISPLNSLETYRDTKNPLPVIIGMHSVLDRLLVSPFISENDKRFFAGMKELTPAVPTEIKNGKEVLSPAEKYENKTYNVEPVVLYGIFPFKHCTTDPQDKETIINTYDEYVHGDSSYFDAEGSHLPLFRAKKLGEKIGLPSYSGWQYTGMCAAMLGKADDALTVLRHNCALKNPCTRFPAMWGPIYDGNPDTDHGANILNTLQLMVMQVYGDKIYILPAWDKSIDVSFRLYADKDTRVEVEYKNGNLNYSVTPEERQNDIIIGI